MSGYHLFGDEPNYARPDNRAITNLFIRIRTASPGICYFDFGMGIEPGD